MADTYRPERQAKPTEIVMTPGQTAAFIGTVAIMSIGAFLFARHAAGREGFTVTLINYPESTRPDGIAKFNDGMGNWVACGQPGHWSIESENETEYPFTIYIYEWVGDTMWERLGFYSFNALVENGHDYIYNCSTGEFYAAW